MGRDSYEIDGKLKIKIKNRKFEQFFQVIYFLIAFLFEKLQSGLLLQCYQEIITVNKKCVQTFVDVNNYYELLQYIVLIRKKMNCYRCRHYVNSELIFLKTNMNRRNSSGLERKLFYFFFSSHYETTFHSEEPFALVFDSFHKFIDFLFLQL